MERGWDKTVTRPRYQNHGVNSWDGYQKTPVASRSSLPKSNWLPQRFNSTWPKGFVDCLNRTKYWRQNCSWRPFSTDTSDKPHTWYHPGIQFHKSSVQSFDGNIHPKWIKQSPDVSFDSPVQFWWSPQRLISPWTEKICQMSDSVSLLSVSTSLA